MYTFLLKRLLLSKKVVSLAFLLLSFLSDRKMLPSQKTSFPMLMSLLPSELLL